MSYAEAWRQVHNLCSMYEAMVKVREALNVAKEYEEDVAKMVHLKESLEQQCWGIDEQLKLKAKDAEDIIHRLDRELETKKVEYDGRIAEMQQRFVKIQEEVASVEASLQASRLFMQEETKNALAARKDELSQLDADIGEKKRRLFALNEQLTSISMAASKILGGRNV